MPALNNTLPARLNKIITKRLNVKDKLTARKPLFWVPGYSNIVGNKVADEVIRGGSQSINLPIDETVKSL